MKYIQVCLPQSWFELPASFNTQQLVYQQSNKELSNVKRNVWADYSATKAVIENSTLAE
jgi:uncharacterized lipoprotein YmbA